MSVLGLDTALDACSAGLCDEAGRVLAARSLPMRAGHAEALPGLVGDVLAEAGTAFGDLTRVGVTVGPGTFTGVRIGLAFARGLGLALGVPVVGVGVLDAIAAAVDDNPNGLPVCVAQDARRDEVYAQTFDAAGTPLTPPDVVAVARLAARLAEAGPLVLAGSAAARLAGLLEPGTVTVSATPALPDPGLLARLAARRPVPGWPPVPLYLRPPDAKPQPSLLPHRSLPVDIAVAGALHVPVLAILHAAAFERQWSEADIARLLAMPGAIALIALEAGEPDRPAGFLIARTAAGEAEILTLAVVPDRRRRSVATRLLEALRARLAARGIGELFIEVALDNVAARALYARHGFLEVGRRRDYYDLGHGRRGDAVVMRLAAA